MSLMPSLVPMARDVSDDLKTWWPVGAPLALEATDASVVVWDFLKKEIVALIAVTDAAGRVRNLAEIASELSHVVGIINTAYDLGRRRGYEHGYFIGQAEYY